MTRHRFFVSGEIQAGDSGELDEARSRQVHSVLRLRPDDEIVVFDGSGAEGAARLTSVSKSVATFHVQSVGAPEREPALALTVGLALLRGDRFELAVQKLTEIGVRRIVPLDAERCVVSFRDARDWDKRAARYQRIIVEAAEQSERVTLPELSALETVESFLQAQPTIALVERGAGTPLVGRRFDDDRAAIAVGPEGGWSDREIELIAEHADQASLGRLILRAETAAIVAAGTLVQRDYAFRDDNWEQGDIQRGS